jgi:hypothetical protein
MKLVWLLNQGKGKSEVTGNIAGAEKCSNKIAASDEQTSPENETMRKN